MMRPILLLCVLLLYACGLPGFATSTPTPTATLVPATNEVPGCISSGPTQKDIDRALTFADKVIESSDWARSYNVSDSRVAVTWMNNANSALAYLETLIFPCGYGEHDIDHYFSDANWKTIFQNYETYEETNRCSVQRLRLYEFDAHNLGYDYKIRYWVEYDTEVRVITLMLVFPVPTAALLDSYSARLFPNLRSCS